MVDCVRLRSILVGIPECCELCHTLRLTHRVVLLREPFELCCVVFNACMVLYKTSVVVDARAWEAREALRRGPSMWYLPRSGEWAG